MKIIIVGATGTMGKHLASAFEREHEVIRVADRGGDVQADITSPESIEEMFKQVESFDALISTAGPTYDPKGSFTLITGALTHDPQLNFANASAANGAVEGFVRAAAIELGNGIRINAVSPTVIENSPHYFPYFPGDIPVTMHQLEYGFRKGVFGANTGQIIKPY